MDPYDTLDNSENFIILIPPSKKFQGHSGEIYQISLVEDLLISCACDNLIKIWNSSSRGLVTHFQMQSRVLAFNSDF